MNSTTITAYAFTLLGPKRALHVGLPEEVPADDGGKGEEEHTDGHEHVAEAAESLIKGGLSQGGALERAGDRFQHAGGEDDQRSHGQDDKGVDKHAHHGHDALILGLFHIGQAWAWGVEPIPASLENRPRATP